MVQTIKGTPQSNHREGGNYVKMQTTGGWKPQQSVNHVMVQTTEGTPQSNHREGGNHAKMQTTGGWKPQQSVNHKSANHRRDTMSNHTGWKPRKGGNHGKVETTGGWKPQKHKTVATEITLKGKE